MRARSHKLCPQALGQSDGGRVSFTRNGSPSRGIGGILDHSPTRLLRTFQTSNAVILKDFGVVGRLRIIEGSINPSNRSGAAPCFYAS